MRKINLRQIINEGMSMPDIAKYYEDELKNMGSLDYLKDIMTREYGLPTEKDALTQCIKEWFDHQDYADDPRKYDVALAYYYAAYGDDEVFRTAMEYAIPE